MDQFLIDINSSLHQRNKSPKTRSFDKTRNVEIEKKHIWTVRGIPYWRGKKLCQMTSL